jgi:hypothetical protein
VLFPEKETCFGKIKIPALVFEFYMLVFLRTNLFQFLASFTYFIKQVNLTGCLSFKRYYIPRICHLGSILSSKILRSEKFSENVIKILTPSFSSARSEKLSS